MSQSDEFDHVDELFDSSCESPPLGQHDTCDDQLSLLVFLCDDQHSTGDVVSQVLTDISWLQFIEGLGVYVVIDVGNAVVDPMTSDRGHVFLVDDAGAIQRRWKFPAETEDVALIRQTIEQAIAAQEVAV
ncbi:hypothetical protein [Haloferax sp. DFSO60]|uniref:hypothetical protein n=1 Tax=Haloferax sp. DFSO60 TaxID=3388652 RepID=UPI00397CA94C